MAIDINIPSQVRTFANLAAFPASGALKTIYIAEDTNKTYRWTGSVYVEVSAAGATASWGAITGTLSAQTDLQNALNAKENTITAGTTSQYFRGDKTFQTLDKSAVGLGNVDNTTDANKPVSTSTQTALNAKQDTLVSGTNIKTVNSTSLLGSGDVAVQATLVSGTNIKTVNSTSLLGSGDIAVQAPITLTTTGTSGAATLVGATLNVPQYSGGGGVNGVHALLPLASGQQTTSSLIIGGLGNSSMIANRLWTYPFFPLNTVVSSNLYINVTTLTAGANCRILIYSDLNGTPNEKLYESANLDCSTLGIKTATTTFTFTAGTKYWLALHSSSTPSLSTIPITSLITLRIYNNTLSASSYIQTVTFGSAPTTWGALSPTNTLVPFIGITQV